MAEKRLGTAEGQGAKYIERLKKIYELSMTLSGDPVDVFLKIARMIGELLDVRVVCLSEIRGDELYFISVYVDGEVMADAGHCPISITPCATVEETKDLRVYDAVAEKFPEASFLKEHNAYSYCGFPTLDNEGTVVAVTCLLDDKPHEFSEEDQELLRIFGQRIGMEIERKKHLDEHKLVEGHIREQKEFLDDILSSLTHPFYVIDARDYTIKMTNPAAQSRGIVEGIACYAATHKRTEPCDGEHPCTIAAIKETKQPVAVEHIHYDEEGNPRIVEVHGYPILDAEGNVAQVIEYNLDVTERKEAEGALKRAETEWEHTFNSMSDFVSVHDTDFRFVRVNKALADHLGKKPEELVGRYCYEVLHGTKEPWPNCPHSKTLKIEKAVTEEVDDPNIGCPLMVTTSPIFDENNELVGSVHIAKDISEIKKLEEENIREKDEKIKAMEQHREYTFEVADRLRNPLQVFKGAIELFEIENLNSEQKKLLEETKKSCKDLEVGIKKLT